MASVEGKSEHAVAQAIVRRAERSGLMLSPALAAAAMALTGVFVRTNAQRLRWVAAPLAEDHAGDFALGTLKPAAAV